MIKAGIFSILLITLLLSGCDPKSKKELAAKEDALLTGAYKSMLSSAPDVFGVSWASSDDMSFDADDFSGYGIDSLGIMMYDLTDGALPAWLCCGYELYFLGRAGSPELSQVLNTRLGLDLSGEYNPLEWAIRRNKAPFGDAWFIPGYLESSADDQDNELAYITAQRFTEYLDERDLLQEAVINNEAAETAWTEFIGGAQTPIDFSYRYHFGREGTFSVVLENADCRFYDGVWTQSSVELYLSDAEEKTLFMEEWFGVTAPKPLKFAFFEDAETETAADADIVISSLTAVDRFTVAHKTALFYAEMCDYITENTHYALAAGFAEYLAYESLPENDREFLVSNADILAYEELRNHHEPNIPAEGFKDYGDEYDTSEIERLLPAQSFARYVAETYGKDGLLTVMPRLDDGYITETTGKTYRDIIEEWAGELERRFD